MNDSELIDQALSVSRALSYNDRVQGPAKHLLRELSHRLGARTVRIHKKSDGYLLTNVFGASRLLNRRESFLWKWFAIPPRGVKVLQTNAPAAK